MTKGKTPEKKNDFDDGSVFQNYLIFPHVICSSKAEIWKIKMK